MMNIHKELPLSFPGCPPSPDPSPPFTQISRHYLALRQGEVGTPVAEIVRKLGISEQTYYRWKRKYGGLGVSELRELKAIREENRRLKTLVADLSLDKTILREALRKKW